MLQSLKFVVNEPTSERWTGSFIFMHGSGGYSMGASMALHLGLRFVPNVAGVVAISPFLNIDSEVYKTLENDTSVQRPPVLICHGDQDQIIDFNWGKQTYECLSKLGIDATFKTLSGCGHSLTIEPLEIVRSWVMEKVPDT